MRRDDASPRDASPEEVLSGLFWKCFLSSVRPPPPPELHVDGGYPWWPQNERVSQLRHRSSQQQCAQEHKRPHTRHHTAYPSRTWARDTSWAYSDSISSGSTSPSNILMVSPCRMASASPCSANIPRTCREHSRRTQMQENGARLLNGAGKALGGKFRAHGDNVDKCWTTAAFGTALALGTAGYRNRRRKIVNSLVVDASEPPKIIILQQQQQKSRPVKDIPTNERPNMKTRATIDSTYHTVGSKSTVPLSSQLRINLFASARYP